MINICGLWPQTLSPQRCLAGHISKLSWFPSKHNSNVQLIRGQCYCCDNDKLHQFSTCGSFSTSMKNGSFQTHILKELTQKLVLCKKKKTKKKDVLRHVIILCIILQNYLTFRFPILTLAEQPRTALAKGIIGWLPHPAIKDCLRFGLIKGQQAVHCYKNTQFTSFASLKTVYLRFKISASMFRLSLSGIVCHQFYHIFGGVAHPLGESRW